MMAPSRVGTISVPAVATNTPSGFATASRSGRPLRVEVHNVGGTTLRLSFESASLGTTGADGVDHFQMPTGSAPATFILAPGQTLYCVSIGAGGALSYTSSEAIPFTL